MRVCVVCVLSCLLPAESNSIIPSKLIAMAKSRDCDGEEKKTYGIVDDTLDGY